MRTIDGCSRSTKGLEILKMATLHTATGCGAAKEDASIHDDDERR